MKNCNIEILECTIRDGSYVIDFQFTPRDTSILFAALESVGFDLIEVGHGVGLNASNAGKGVAAATDEEYMQAVVSTRKRAQWGMFFIPGIGRHEDLELGASYGMHIVRIGTNASEVEESEEYVEHAKKLGMYVSANLMKSYVLSPKELAAKAKLSERYGVDIVTLVDSAGCMLPSDVRDYITALKDAVNVPLGFHSHNNLGLSTANVLMAIDCGVQRVDTTMQGMGRGGGNLPTEVLLTVLKKRGIDPGIDLNRLMDISERLIRPMMQKGWDSIDLISGYAGFHSSHFKTVLKYADLYGVDPRDLIVDLCKVDQVYAPEELVEDLARQLQRRQAGKSGLHPFSPPRFAFPGAKTEETLNEPLAAAARRVAREIKAAAKKRGLHSALNIVMAHQPVEKATVSYSVQEEFDCVIGSVEVDNPRQLEEVVEAVDGIVDIFLVDSELKPDLGQDQSLASLAYPIAKQSRVLGYKGSAVWVRSIDQEIVAMLQDVRGHRITVSGTDSLALKLALSLMEQGAVVTLTGDGPEQLQTCVRALRQIASGPMSLQVEANPIDAARGAEVLVRFARQQPLISRSMVEVLAPDGIVFDAGIGSVSAEAIAYSNEHGIRVVQPDMRAALASELASLVGAQRTVTEFMGRGEIAGVPVVGGGLIGQHGDIVVDSVSNPSRVVGIVDGRGRILPTAPELSDQIQTVESEIMRRQALIV